MAKFMGKIRENKVKFDTNKMVLTAGSTSANETLMFCLANPGDAFLIPAPYYPGYVYIFTLTFLNMLVLFTRETKFVFCFLSS